MAAPQHQAIGVIRNVKKTSYTQLYVDQMEEQMANGKYKCVDERNLALGNGGLFLMQNAECRM